MEELSVLPATYWILSLDRETLQALLWSVGEYGFRGGSQDHPRAIGGIKALWELVHRRRLLCSWAPETGLFNYIIDGKDHVPVLQPELLLSPHADRTVTSAKSICEMCRDEMFLETVRLGKYSNGWKGNYHQLLVYAFCAGQLAKTKWQWPPTACQAQYLDAIFNAFQPWHARGTDGMCEYNEVVREAVADFQLALAYDDAVVRG
ncbi:unnamed protein product [Phaeothamnion confervicola]